MAHLLLGVLFICLDSLIFMFSSTFLKSGSTFSYCLVHQLVVLLYITAFVPTYIVVHINLYYTHTYLHTYVQEFLVYSRMPCFQCISFGIFWATKIIKFLCNSLRYLSLSVTNTHTYLHICTYTISY